MDEGTGRYAGTAPRPGRVRGPRPVRPTTLPDARQGDDRSRRWDGPERVFDRVSAWVREHPLVVDLLLTAGLVVVLVGPELLYPIDERFLRATLAVALVLPVALRRVATRLAFVLEVVAGLLGLLLLGYGWLPASAAALVVVHAVVAYDSRRAGRLVLVVGVVSAVALVGRTYGFSSTGLGVLDLRPYILAGGGVLLVVAAWSIGHLTRVRASHERALAERARLLEAERDQQAVIATAAERARIAREMHDVVAHSLSVVVAQADGGRYAARADPAAAVRALETIAGTGRQALGDMRGLLGVLRQDEAARRTPQPGSGDVESLVAEVRAAGLDVRLEETGARRPLPPSPGLAVFRITQEALTNVLKHAGPQARALVRLRWLADAVEVDVLDDGRGAAATPGHPGGQGLVGMRERAALVGGRVEAGPMPGGGWRVRALLPDDAPPVAVPPPARTATGSAEPPAPVRTW
ncbi:sensor histidine kinase [Pseudokineococcus sp. 1T1Z-3]|uniref:sensor histidine kinase n=1 Tax=Pseudokineococcus sp. 1T1Z-3 TaxID=3132745 RepID=UPI0030AA3C17